MNKVVKDLIIEIFLKHPVMLTFVVLGILYVLFGNRIIEKAEEINSRKKLKNANKQHNKIVKEIKGENENKCPLCGENLIQRNGKYGIFIGCTNYPKCKFTKNV